MRKHIDYFYKCFDRVNFNEQERIFNECFNEYGYNFSSNSRRNIDKDEMLKKTNYQVCQKNLKEKNQKSK